MRTNWKRLLAAGLVGLAPGGGAWADEGQATGAPAAVDQPAEVGSSSAGGGTATAGGADSGAASSDAAVGGGLSVGPSGFGGGGGQAVGSSEGSGFGGGGGRRGGGGQPAFGGGLGSSSGVTGTVALFGGGGGGGGAVATGSGMPSSLEEAIGLAMRANPEVQLARAKVDEARAAYNQTRLRTVAELTQIYRQREALQQANALESEASAAKVRSAKETAQQNEKLRATGALPEQALQQALDEARAVELDHQRVVLGHRQKLASLDTQLMLLMGLESDHLADATAAYFGFVGGPGTMQAGTGSVIAGMGGASMRGGMTRGGGAAGGGGGPVGAGGGISGGTGEGSGGPAGGGGGAASSISEGSASGEGGKSTGGGLSGAGDAAGGGSTGGGAAPQAGAATGRYFGAGFGGMPGGAGGGGMTMMVGGMGGNTAAANARPSIPESQKHLRDELEKLTALDLTDSPLTDVVILLKNQHGIEMQIGPGVARDQPITMSASGLKLKDMFLLMTDLFPDLCFIVRDYGLLVTTREKGMELYGAAIPADLPLLTAPPTPRTVAY